MKCLILIQNWFINYEQANNDIKIYENRTNIGINKKSWTDPNVLNTFKGKIINYDNLLGDPEEVLLEIIFHLNSTALILI